MIMKHVFFLLFNVFWKKYHKKATRETVVSFSIVVCVRLVHCVLCCSDDECMFVSLLKAWMGKELSTCSVFASNRQKKSQCFAR